MHPKARILNFHLLFLMLLVNMIKVEFITSFFWIASLCICHGVKWTQQFELFISSVEGVEVPWRSEMICEHSLIRQHIWHFCDFPSSLQSAAVMHKAGIEKAQLVHQDFVVCYLILLGFVRLNFPCIHKCIWNINFINYRTILDLLWTIKVCWQWAVRLSHMSLPIMLNYWVYNG
jgi:hypothetical protein